MVSNKKYHELLSEKNSLMKSIEHVKAQQCNNVYAVEPIENKNGKCARSRYCYLCKNRQLFQFPDIPYGKFNFCKYAAPCECYEQIPLPDNRVWIVGDSVKRIIEERIDNLQNLDINLPVDAMTSGKITAYKETLRIIDENVAGYLD